jgi:hypothetical protein
MAPPFFIFLAARIPNYDIRAAAHDVRTPLFWFGRRIFNPWRHRFIERYLRRVFRVAIRLARSVMISKPIHQLIEGR